MSFFDSPVVKSFLQPNLPPSHPPKQQLQQQQPNLVSNTCTFSSGFPSWSQNQTRIQPIEPSDWDWRWKNANITTHSQESKSKSQNAMETDDIEMKVSLLHIDVDMEVDLDHLPPLPPTPPSPSFHKPILSTTTNVEQPKTKQPLFKTENFFHSNQMPPSIFTSTHSTQGKNENIKVKENKNDDKNNQVFSFCEKQSVIMPTLPTDYFPTSNTNHSGSKDSTPVFSSSNVPTSNNSTFAHNNAVSLFSFSSADKNRFCTSQSPCPDVAPSELPKTNNNNKTEATLFSFDLTPMNQGNYLPGTQGSGSHLIGNGKIHPNHEFKNSQPNQVPLFFPQTQTQTQTQTQQTHPSNSLLMRKNVDEFGPVHPKFGFCFRKGLKLFPHQESIIEWWIKRESTKHHGILGGILNVMMGLGKTVMSYVMAAMSLNLSKPKPNTFSSSSPSLSHRPTLIITNKSLLRTWRQDWKKFFGSGLNVLIFYKMDCKKKFRTISYQEWMSYDVIVTTYDVIQSEAVRSRILPKSKQEKSLSVSILDEYVFQENKLARGPELLYQCEFRRIIADESQRFANHKTKLFYAVCLLKSSRKSCLTGTPIRNSDLDIWSQFRFCGLNVVKNPKNWSLQQFKSLRLDENLNTMTYEKAGVQLPLLTRHDVFITLEKEEAEIYELFYRLQKHIWNNFKNKTGQLSYFQVLSILLRLRQVCIAPFVVTSMAKRANILAKLHESQPKPTLIQRGKITKKENELEEEQDDGGEDKEEEQEQEGDEEIRDEEKTKDSEKNQNRKTKQNSQHTDECMSLDEFFDYFKLYKDFTPDRLAYLKKWMCTKHSTAGVYAAKFKSMIQVIKEHVPADEKIMIFSNFTSTLDLLLESLELHGWSDDQVSMIDGGDSDVDREHILDQFQYSPTCRFLLGPYSVMSTGLNMQHCCCHVFFLDPWWTPTAESQAECRVHRIGQTKKVQVYRFLIRNSIEQRVVSVMDKKRKIAQDFSGEEAAEVTPSEKIDENFLSSIF